MASCRYCPLSYQSDKYFEYQTVTQTPIKYPQAKREQAYSSRSTSVQLNECYNYLTQTLSWLSSLLPLHSNLEECGFEP